jgi:hypothetical protein
MRNSDCGKSKVYPIIPVPPLKKGGRGGFDPHDLFKDKFLICGYNFSPEAISQIKGDP